MKRTRLRRGATAITYVAVVGLVAVAASVAVRQTGEQTAGLISKLASQINTVAGAVDGNQRPVWAGTLSDQLIDQYDTLTLTVAGFSDPEDDPFSLELALTGALSAADLTPERIEDSLTITGVPAGSGTLSVVARDALGRTATAGPLEITVAPNTPPTVATLPSPVTIADGEPLALTFSGIVDDQGDQRTAFAVIDGAVGGEVPIEGETATTNLALGPGVYEIALEVEDEHDAVTRTAAVTATVAAPSCDALLAVRPATASGVHAIDPDGPGGEPAFDVYCDMDTNGGGWTLVATMADDGDNYWRWNNAWVNRHLQNGNSYRAPTLTQDHQSPAWAQLAGDQVLMRHATNTGRWLRYDSLVNGQTLASLYPTELRNIGEFSPAHKSGIWVAECGTLSMSILREDHDGWTANYGYGAGFVWQSVNNGSCPYDDNRGTIIDGQRPDAEKWRADDFYGQNFGGSAMAVFVR